MIKQVTPTSTEAKYDVPSLRIASAEEVAQYAASGTPPAGWTAVESVPEGWGGKESVGVGGYF